MIAEWLKVRLLNYDTVYGCIAAINGGQIVLDVQRLDVQGVAPVEGALGDAGLRLKFQVQHPASERHRMLRWTNEASTSAVRNVA